MFSAYKRTCFIMLRSARLEFRDFRECSLKGSIHSLPSREEEENCLC